VTVTSLMGIVMLVVQRIFDADSARLSLWLAPAYYAGLVAGIRLFPRFDELRFRRFTLALLIVVSGVILIR
jgi:uncharacterized membrane protein YfcA